MCNLCPQHAIHEEESFLAPLVDRVVPRRGRGCDLRLGRIAPNGVMMPHYDRFGHRTDRHWSSPCLRRVYLVAADRLDEVALPQPKAEDKTSQTTEIDKTEAGGLADGAAAERESLTRAP
jgi:hypothetical protein